MENNESKKDENSCNFYHQLHTENVNFTKNSLVQIALQISCMSEKIRTSVVHLNCFQTKLQTCSLYLQICIWNSTTQLEIKVINSIWLFSVIIVLSFVVFLSYWYFIFLSTPLHLLFDPLFKVTLKFLDDEINNWV